MVTRLLQPVHLCDQVRHGGGFRQRLQMRDAGGMSDPHIGPDGVVLHELIHRQPHLGPALHAADVVTAQ